MVSQLLTYLLDPNDKDRAFVSFTPHDSTALLINNFGGMSNFELEALTAVTTRLLRDDWSITPTRVLIGCFETSLNAPGWSISLLNLSGIEHEAGTGVSQLIKLLDSDTTASAWPRNGYRNTPSDDRKDAQRSESLANKQQTLGP